MTLQEMATIARSIGVERIAASRLISNVPTLLFGVTVTGIGQPVIKSIIGTDPPANTEYTLTVPSGVRWLVTGVYAVLVTDSTVATRLITFTIDNGVNVLYFAASALTQTASMTVKYNLAAGTAAAAASGYYAVVPISTNILIETGYRIRSETTGRQATDNWSAPQALVQEWIIPRSGVKLYDGSNTQGEQKLSLFVPAGETRNFKYDPPLLFRRGLYSSLGSEIESASFQTALFKE